MLEALDDYAGAVMRGGAVDELTKVLCAAMVAGLNVCTPALIVHRKRARELGAGAAALNDLWDNARSSLYTPAQQAALAAAVALTREPRALPDNLRDALQQHFNEAQIVEVLCVIGLENCRNRVMNAMQGKT